MFIKANNGHRFLLWSLLVVILDQLTKHLVVNHIEYGSSGIEVFPFFNITHVYNTGAAFSFLAGMGGWQRWFFVVVALSITLILLAVLLRTPRSSRYTCLGIALVIGGAIGNLIDRVVYGYVVDFLLFYINTKDFFWAYPTFNVADIAVCVGAAVLIVIGLFGKEKEEDKH